MPKLCSLPATVPTSASCGRSALTGFGRGGGAAATGTGATAGGGRREGEKIGRSRVVASVASGIVHRGLALLARSGSVGFTGAAALTTTGAARRL
jgi:hypothetical protein